jgi:hypothetical protein
LDTGVRKDGTRKSKSDGRTLVGKKKRRDAGDRYEHTKLLDYF